MSSPASVPSAPLIDCQSVWKVFGNNADKALRAITERGLGKSQVMQEFNCVVGVANVSLTLAKGEILCVMGLSGSGKSTLVRLFNRLIEPSLGKILLRGQDVGAMKADELRRTRAQHIGMVFQNVALLPHRNVLENAAFGLEVQKIDKIKRQEIARAALTKVGLADWGDRYPDELSGGMQQRVGLARALAADPEVILMDEPFSALDPLIRRQLQDEFRQVSKSLGKSSVFITHDLDEAIRIGDRIAIMKDGAVIQIGNAEEIILKPADDYVADFVAGISRLHFIKAHSVMHPVSAFVAAFPTTDVEKLARTSPDAEVNELINITLREKQEGVAVVAGGAVVGIVTPRSLLQGVKGKAPEEAMVL